MTAGQQAGRLSKSKHRKLPPSCWLKVLCRCITSPQLCEVCLARSVPQGDTATVQGAETRPRKAFWQAAAPKHPGIPLIQLLRRASWHDRGCKAACAGTTGSTLCSIYPHAAFKQSLSHLESHSSSCCAAPMRASAAAWMAASVCLPSSERDSGRAEAPSECLPLGSGTFCLCSSALQRWLGQPGACRFQGRSQSTELEFRRPGSRPPMKEQGAHAKSRV